MLVFWNRAAVATRNIGHVQRGLFTQSSKLSGYSQDWDYGVGCSTGRERHGQDSEGALCFARCCVHIL